MHMGCATPQLSCTPHADCFGDIKSSERAEFACMTGILVPNRSFDRES